MPHLHLTVLTPGTKPDVCENGFQNFKLKLIFMFAILTRLSIIFINYISRNLDNTKILYFYISFSFGTWLSNLHV